MKADREQVERGLEQLRAEYDRVEKETLLADDEGKLEALLKRKRTLLDMMQTREDQKEVASKGALGDISRMNELINHEIKSSRERVESRTRNLRKVLRTLPESPYAKSRLYLFVLLFGFFLAATAEIAIMNKFTGEVIQVGTLSDKLNEISELFNRGTGFQGVTAFPERVIFWDVLRHLLDLIILISFFSIPFLMSFVTKLWFDIRSSEDSGKKIFFFLAAPVSVLYIAFLAYETVVQTEFTWQFGCLLFLISFSILLVSGLLLHNFIQGYENFRKTTKKSLLPWQKGFREHVEKMRDGFVSALEAKKESLDRMRMEMKEVEKKNHENVCAFRAMAEKKPGIDVEPIKEAATAELKEGYKHGSMTRGKVEVEEDHLKNREVEDLARDGKKMEMFRRTFDE